jgi:hypothetical protein
VSPERKLPAGVPPPPNDRLMSQIRRRYPNGSPLLNDRLISPLGRYANSQMNPPNAWRSSMAWIERNPLDPGNLFRQMIPQNRPAPRNPTTQKAIVNRRRRHSQRETKRSRRRWTIGELRAGLGVGVRLQISSIVRLIRSCLARRA